MLICNRHLIYIWTLFSMLKTAYMVADPHGAYFATSASSGQALSCDIAVENVCILLLTFVHVSQTQLLITCSSQLYPISLSVNCDMFNMDGPKAVCRRLMPILGGSPRVTRFGIWISGSLERNRGIASQMRTLLIPLAATQSQTRNLLFSAAYKLVSPP